MPKNAGKSVHYPTHPQGVEAQAMYAQRPTGVTVGKIVGVAYATDSIVTEPPVLALAYDLRSTQSGMGVSRVGQGLYPVGTGGKGTSAIHFDVCTAWIASPLTRLAMTKKTLWGHALALAVRIKLPD
jgi:hypothetical protein